MDLTYIVKIGILLCFDLPRVSACVGDFTNRYGNITSPNYSSTSEYPANSFCSWNISTPVGTEIVIKFLDFKLACNGDYIQVRDLSSNKVLHQQEKVCDGWYLRMPIYSDSNRINIHFVSDDNKQARGFKLEWKVKSILTWNSNFATWPEAMAICNEQGGTLLNDVVEYQEEVFEKMQERHVTEIWQGQYITPWVWLKGCFQFNNLDEYTTYFELKSNQMKECVRHCNSWNYFGLQEKKCFCFDTFAGDSVVTEPNCATPCPGNSAERCGGNSSLTVYMNDICFNNSSQWNGTVSRTKEGNICLPWKNITQLVGDSRIVFSDGSVDLASNSCRDPNGTGSLWCYVSQNRTELCDVPPCVTNVAGKISRCMSVYSTGERFVFTSNDCSSKLRSICLGVDKPHYAMNEPESWETQRNNAREYHNGASCKSMVDSSLFYMDKGVLNAYNTYWIGYTRSYTTAKSSAVTGKLGKCFTVSDKNGQKSTEEVTDCYSRRHFICQSVPVTCGRLYSDLTNGSFSTPNYPWSYDALMHCIWTICIPEDHYMMLSVYISIEDSPSCQYDFVKIYEGTSVYDGLNTTLCGNTIRKYDYIATNITLEFLSDETVESFGVFVAWTFVPMTQVSTSTIAPSAEPQEDNNESGNKTIIALSDGALAGLVTGIVFLVVLTCGAGFLCGHRRRSTLSNKDDVDNSTNKKIDKTNGSAVNLTNLNNQNIKSDNSCDNSGAEAGVSPTDRKPPNGKPPNVSLEKIVSDSDRELDGAGAVYSTVNKPQKDAGNEPYKLTPIVAINAKQDERESEPDEMYNSLNEKVENIYANKTENVYNNFNDTESIYDRTSSPKEAKKGRTVASNIETYDHKK